MHRFTLIALLTKKRLKAEHLTQRALIFLFTNCSDLTKLLLLASPKRLRNPLRRYPSKCNDGCGDSIAPGAGSRTPGLSQGLREGPSVRRSWQNGSHDNAQLTRAGLLEEAIAQPTRAPSALPNQSRPCVMSSTYQVAVRYIWG